MIHPLLTSKYARDLALKINNPNTPALDRAIACVELAQFAELANAIHAANTPPPLPEPDNTPMYKWHNGARVRVK